MQHVIKNPNPFVSSPTSRIYLPPASRKSSIRILLTMDFNSRTFAVLRTHGLITANKSPLSVCSGYHDLRAAAHYPTLPTTSA